MRLNTAREILRRINIGSMPMAKFSLNKTERIMAKIKFAAGPAKEISAESLWGFLRLKGSNGTGLAQPNGKGRRPLAKRMVVTISKVVPVGS